MAKTKAGGRYGDLAGVISPKDGYGITIGAQDGSTWGDEPFIAIGSFDIINGEGNDLSRTNIIDVGNGSIDRI